MPIVIKCDPKFAKTNRFLDNLVRKTQNLDLESYGKMGVEALQSATPVRTGKTAASWYYEIKKSDGKLEIDWLNSNMQGGENIALLIQYGHGTRNGSWIEGRDYINPALQPVFDKIAQGAWKEVTSVTS